MHATSQKTDLPALFSELEKSTQGTAKYQRTLEDIRGALSDPRIPIDIETLPYDSPQIREAHAVYDALESVTNGMYNPEVLSLIAHIDEESPFFYWQRMIYAILSYYQGDMDNMFAFLEEIPDHVPPAPLKPALFYLRGNTGFEQLSKSQKKLASAIREDSSYIRSAVEQLKEYIEEGMEEAFAETASLFIKDIAFSHSQVARRLAITSLQHADSLEFQSDTALSFLIEHIQHIFGEREGNRLIALSFTGTSPDMSILFWIRLLLRRLQEDDIPLEESMAYLEIAGEEALRLNEDRVGFEEDKNPGNRNLDTIIQKEYTDYFNRLSSLTLKLVDEFARHFPSFAFPDIDPLKTPLRLLTNFVKNSTDEKKAQVIEKPEGREERIVEPGKTKKHKTERRSGPIQLELFS